MLGSFNLLPFNRGTSKECFVSDSISIDFIEELNFINRIVSENLLIVASETVNNFSKKAIDSLLIVSIESFSDRQFNTIDYIITNTLESLNLLGNLPVINDSLIISTNTTFIEIANGIFVVDDLIIDIFDESVEKLEGADLVENAPILLEESQALLVTTSGLDPPIINLIETANYVYELPVVTDNLIVSTTEINSSKEYFVSDLIVLTITDQISHNREFTISDSFSFVFIDRVNLFTRKATDIISPYVVNDIVNSLIINHNRMDSLILSSLEKINYFEKKALDSLKILVYSDVKNETQTYVKVNNNWYNIKTMWIKVDGVWKSVLKVYNKISGTWELR